MGINKFNHRPKDGERELPKNSNSAALMFATIVSLGVGIGESVAKAESPLPGCAADPTCNRLFVDVYRPSPILPEQEQRLMQRAQDFCYQHYINPTFDYYIEATGEKERVDAMLNIAIENPDQLLYEELSGDVIVVKRRPSAGNAIPSDFLIRIEHGQIVQVGTVKLDPHGWIEWDKIKDNIKKWTLLNLETKKTKKGLVGNVDRIRQIISMLGLEIEKNTVIRTKKFESVKNISPKDKDALVVEVEKWLALNAVFPQMKKYQKGELVDFIDVYSRIADRLNRLNEMRRNVLDPACLPIEVKGGTLRIPKGGGPLTIQQKEKDEDGQPVMDETGQPSVLYSFITPEGYSMDWIDADPENGIDKGYFKLREQCKDAVIKAYRQKMLRLGRRP